MDNLSHSVAGLAAGELIQRSLRDEENPEHNRVRRRLLLVSCWAASNLPDLDILLTPLLPPPLGYLLHHRGHTHTFLYAIAQALLLCALLWLLWPAARRLLAHSARARGGLALAVGGGLLLHIAMDYLNSYGVHPLHPFDSRWFYGDMVFILEPVFWIAFGAPLAMLLPWRIARALAAALLAGVPAFFAAKGFLLWPAVAVLALAGAVLGMLQYRAGSHGRTALAGAFILVMGFVGAQHAASVAAHGILEAAWRGRDPSARLIDVALTAFPANPLCWNFVSLESKEASGVYRLRQGTVSIVPGLLPVAGCPGALMQDRGEPNAGPGIFLVSEQEDKLGLLRALRRRDCRFDAWLRFARMPAVHTGNASDLRFGFGQRVNFSTIKLGTAEDADCPDNVPAWGYPRADLLAAPDELAGR